MRLEALVVLAAIAQGTVGRGTAVDRAVRNLVILAVATHAQNLMIALVVVRRVPVPMMDV